MPETVRVVTFIEAPHRRRWGWIHRLMKLALETLDTGRADCEVFSIL